MGAHGAAGDGLAGGDGVNVEDYPVIIQAQFWQRHSTDGKGLLTASLMGRNKNETMPLCVICLTWNGETEQGYLPIRSRDQYPELLERHWQKIVALV